LVRAQDPSSTLPDRGGNLPVALPVASDAAPTVASHPNLNSVEQAAYDEIVKSASTSKVFCIIRSKETGGESDVITLDSVSPDVVRSLENRAKSASPGSTSEVVCVIRPNEPGGKSEVITLDSVSPEFVRGLACHTSGAAATMLR
jgi:hypothetical protein